VRRHPDRHGHDSVRQHPVRDVIHAMHALSVVRRLARLPMGVQWLQRSIQRVLSRGYSGQIAQCMTICSMCVSSTTLRGSIPMISAREHYWIAKRQIDQILSLYITNAVCYR
jgi:hypothetical protein